MYCLHLVRLWHQRLTAEDLKTLSNVLFLPELPVLMDQIWRRYVIFYQGNISCVFCFFQSWQFPGPRACPLKEGSNRRTVASDHFNNNFHSGWRICRPTFEDLLEVGYDSELLVGIICLSMSWLCFSNDISRSVSLILCSFPPHSEW